MTTLIYDDDSSPTDSSVEPFVISADDLAAATKIAAAEKATRESEAEYQSAYWAKQAAQRAAAMTDADHAKKVLKAEILALRPSPKLENGSVNPAFAAWAAEYQASW